MSELLFFGRMCSEKKAKNFCYKLYIFLGTHFDLKIIKFMIVYVTKYDYLHYISELTVQCWPFQRVFGH